MPPKKASIERRGPGRLHTSGAKSETFCISIPSRFNPAILRPAPLSLDTALTSLCAPVPNIFDAGPPGTRRKKYDAMAWVHFSLNGDRTYAQTDMSHVVFSSWARDNAFSLETSPANVYSLVNACGRRSSSYVYLLADPHNDRTTFIGCSRNPFRKTALKTGGIAARAGRPARWKLVMVVGPFRDAVAAHRFRALWNLPRGRAVATRVAHGTALAAHPRRQYWINKE